ncbi:ESPR domain-containing protein, partial [Megasphaera stantonii]|uniref:ESPR domain-containing protein n=1 Tax=Megasphaera stantonii TaxID=2144175 RepID=UPI001957A7F0
MNRIYKVIWSKVKHQYVVVSELAHSCTKGTSRKIEHSAIAVLTAMVLTTSFGGISVEAAGFGEAWKAAEISVGAAEDAKEAAKDAGHSAFHAGVSAEVAKDAAGVSVGAAGMSVG